VNQQQGTVRVPVDVAIDVIARRGVEPGVVGGTGAGAAPAAGGQLPGANVQMARPPQALQTPPASPPGGQE
jgi:hypothetical protein